MRHQLQIHKEAFSFSAGHFTIFSAQERETMHGHNYYVSVTFDFIVANNGLSFDYRVYKKKINSLCERIDRHFLLPAFSPFLQIDESDPQYYYATFAGKKMPFLKEDIIILPLTNITIETLSFWFLSELTGDTEMLKQHDISDVTVEVFNGLEQSGSSRLSEIKKHDTSL